MRLTYGEVNGAPTLKEGYSDLAMNTRLVEQTLQFLSRNANDGVIPPELRESLYVSILTDDHRRLEEVLLEELLHGRSVIITGSAGGGKTSLINRMMTIGEFHSTNRMAVEPGLTIPTNYEGLLVVRDLTALSPTERLNLFAQNQGAQFLLAANVGVLQQLSDQNLIRDALEILQGMQRGLNPSNSSMPVVVDMGQINPIRHALSGLLGHPLIHAAAQLHVSNQGEDPELSLRLRCLKQLLDPVLIGRLVRLTELANGSFDVTFREVWNFLSDIFLGGTDEGLVPTSSWFWRFFYGDSELASRFRNAVAPELWSLPDSSRMLFKGLSLQMRRLIPNWVSIGVSPEVMLEEGNAEEMIRAIAWSRIQMSLLRDGDINSLSLSSFGLERIAIANDSPSDRTQTMLEIERINSYFDPKDKFKLDGSSLALWSDQLVERRTNGSRAIVNFGTVAESRLSIGHSSALANISSTEVRGNRQFLQAKRDSGQVVASLELTARLRAALLLGRKVHISAREFSNEDLALRNFFIRCANSIPVDGNDRLRVLTTSDSDVTFANEWDFASSPPRMQVY